MTGGAAIMAGGATGGSPAVFCAGKGATFAMKRASGISSLTGGVGKGSPFQIISKMSSNHEAKAEKSGLDPHLRSLRFSRIRHTSKKTKKEANIVHSKMVLLFMGREATRRFL